MALTDVRAYFRTRMNALNYKEWRDGFNFENIPVSLLDGSYHITSGQIVGGDASQSGYEFLYPVTVRLFLKGYRKPIDAIEDSIEKGENIFNEVLKATNRLGTGATILNISNPTMEPLPLDASNDNAVILEMQFVARVINCFS